MLRISAILLALGLSAPAALADDFDTYAQACKQAVGDLPPISCADGVPVPITVDGHTPSSYSKDMTCDRPGLLANGDTSDGQCVPYSRILNLSNDTMQVSVMCRQKTIRDETSTTYDEIDVIAHNPQTGATCWFMAKDEEAGGVSGENVPSPTEGQADFWADLSDVLEEGCGNCHDNDPFMYSPFVGQVLDHVPSNPLGPYYHVEAGSGFSGWPLSHFDLPDNTCTGCHRIGVNETCNELARFMTGKTTPPGSDAFASAFPGNTTMPPLHGLSQEQWDATYGASLDQVLKCCSAPDDASCRVTPIFGSK